MQHDGEARQAAGYLLQNIETQAGLLPGLEFVGAVACADGDRQRIHPGLGHKFLHLGRVCELGVLRRNIHRVFDARQLAQLAFHHHAVGVGIVHHLLGHGDVLLKAVLAAVDHHGGKTAVDAGLADVKVFTVVQVQRDGQACLQNGGLHQLDQVVVLGVFAGPRGYLQDDRGIFQLCGFGDALHDLHIIHIEGANGIPALIRLFKHFFCAHQRHFDLLPVLLMSLF